MLQNAGGAAIEQSHDVVKVTIITSMTFLGVEYGVIYLLWFFMISDTVLGVWKSVVLYGWEDVTRKKLLIGVGTKLSIIFIPLSMALTGALLQLDLKIFVMTAMYTLIANDATSCYTNLLSIRKKKNYENKDLIELLINTLRTIIFNSVKAGIDRLKSSEICRDDDNSEDIKNSNNNGSI